MLDPYWGICPKCASPANRWLNMGAYHWVSCDDCLTKWSVGANLVSSWRTESPGDWVANEMRLENYEEVEPLHLTSSEEDEITL